MPIPVCVACYLTVGSRFQPMVRLSLFALAFGVSVMLTRMAYHVRQAYDAWPTDSDFVYKSLVWAFVCTSPTLIALVFRYHRLSSALWTGAVISFLALIFMTPANFWLIALLSFE
jgi:hypothetical protein